MRKYFLQIYHLTLKKMCQQVNTKKETNKKMNPTRIQKNQQMLINELNINYK